MLHADQEKVGSGWTSIVPTVQYCSCSFISLLIILSLLVDAGALFCNRRNGPKPIQGHELLSYCYPNH